MELRQRDKKSYLLSEFPQGWEWKHWRDPEAVKGDWVKTDDDVLLWIKNYYEARGSDGLPRLLVQHSLGLYDKMRKSPLLMADKYKMYVTDNGQGMGARYKKGAPTAREKNWARMVVTGIEPEQAAAVIWPHLQHERLLGKIKGFGKNERLVQFMSDLLKDALATAGIDENFVAKQIKKLATDADKSSVQLDATKLVLELLGYGKVKEVQKSVFEADFFVDPAQLSKMPSRELSLPSKQIGTGEGVVIHPEAKHDEVIIVPDGINVADVILATLKEVQ